MKKKMLLLFQVLTKIIIIFLAVSTFFIQQEIPENYSDHFFVKLLCLDHFYNSWINLTLFGLMVILMVVSIFMRKVVSKSQVILHGVIALAFIVIIFDKSTNHRTAMPILEGESVNFSNFTNDENYNHNIKLEKFNIEYHEGSNMPSAYTSTLKIDDNDPVLLNVNKPVKIGNYRLYQNAFDKIPVYTLTFKNENFSISIDDTLEVDDHTFSILMSENRRVIIFSFNEQKKTLSPMGGNFQIEEFEFDLKMEELAYVSVIEVASVNGMKILLFLGLGYLGALGYCFWRKKS